VAFFFFCEQVIFFSHLHSLQIFTLLWFANSVHYDKIIYSNEPSVTRKQMRISLHPSSYYLGQWGSNYKFICITVWNQATQISSTFCTV